MVPVLAPVAVLGTDTWRAPGPIQSVAVSGDRVWAVTDEVVVGFDAEGRTIASFPACPGDHLSPWGRVAVSPAGDQMAVPCGDVRVVSLPGGDERWRTRGLTGSIRPVFSQDGARLVIVGEGLTPEGTIGEWRLRVYSAGGDLARDVQSPYAGMVAARDGFVAATLDGATLVGLDGALAERWRAPTTGVWWWIVGGHVCTGSYQGVACLDSRTGAQGPSLPASGEIERVGRAGDGLWASWDPGKVHAWAPGHDAAPLPVDVPGDGWTPWRDGAIEWEGRPRIVRLGADGRRVTPAEEWSAPFRVALDRGGRALALVDAHERLFAGPVDGALREVPGRWAWQDLAVSPGGAVVYARHADGAPTLVDVATGAERPLRLDGTPAQYASVAFAADGTARATVQVTPQDPASWATLDPATGALRVVAPARSVYDIDWLSADGRRVLWRWDDSVSVVDGATGEPSADSVYAPRCGVTERGGHFVTCAETSDGERLGDGPVVPGEITVGPGSAWVVRPYGEATLDVHDGAELVAKIQLPTVDDVVFSADGRRFAAILPDGRVAVFAAP